jgi:threonine dehydrogenase-like Zn-dependent dehydrogenase
MKAAVNHGVKDVRVEEVPDPIIEKPTDAIVRVSTGAVCGSDLHIYRGHFPLKDGDTLGHEFMGYVEEVGRDVKTFKHGDKVVSPFWVSCGNCYFCHKGLTTSCLNGGCFGFGDLLGGNPGCQAEYVRVPLADGTLVKVPENLSDDSNDERVLFLGDNISTGYHGALSAGIKPGDSVVVFGDGAVGLFATFSATIFDPSYVVTIGHHNNRLEVAKKYGADITINSLNEDPMEKIMELSDGRGADVVIEGVGNTDSLGACLQIIRPGGTVSFVGLFWESFPINMTDFFLRNLTLRGGVAPARTYMPILMPLIEGGKLDPTLVITHRMSLDQVSKGYELMDQREEGAIKVIFSP